MLFLSDLFVFMSVLACIVPFSGIIPNPKEQVIVLDICPCATKFDCIAGPNASIIVPQGKVGQFGNSFDWTFCVCTIDQSAKLPVLPIEIINNSFLRLTRLHFFRDLGNLYFLRV